MQTLSLTKRLQVITELLPACECIADVGCDHGKLGLHLLETDKCKRLIASDISENSLEKAKRLFSRFGLENRVNALLHDGMPPKGWAQAAVVAGIGGSNLAQIIHKGIESAKDMRTLVLQPSDDAAVLRKALWTSGFAFEKETIVFDHRFFPIMAVRYDGTVRPELSALACEIGPYNMRHPDANVLAYAAWRIRIWEKAVKTPAGNQAGMQKQQEARRLVETLESWRKENAHASDT